MSKCTFQPLSQGDELWAFMTKGTKSQVSPPLAWLGSAMERVKGLGCLGGAQSGEAAAARGGRLGIGADFLFPRLPRGGVSGA